jgi:hypothetical protein
LGYDVPGFGAGGGKIDEGIEGTFLKSIVYMHTRELIENMATRMRFPRKKLPIDLTEDRLRSPFQITGRSFPLAQRERAGVRENRSNANQISASNRFSSHPSKTHPNHLKIT